MDFCLAQEVLMDLQNWLSAPECLKLMATFLQDELDGFRSSSNTAEIFLLTVTLKIGIEMLKLPQEVSNLRTEKDELENQMRFEAAARNHQKYINAAVAQHFKDIQPVIQQTMQNWSCNMDKLYHDLNKLQVDYQIFQESDGRNETFTESMNSLDLLFKRVVVIDNFLTWDTVADNYFAEIQALQRQTEIMFSQTLDKKLILRQVEKLSQIKRRPKSGKITKQNFLHYMRLQRLKNLMLTMILHLYKSSEISATEDPSTKVEHEVMLYFKHTNHVRKILDDADHEIPAVKESFFLDQLNGITLPKIKKNYKYVRHKS